MPTLCKGLERHKIVEDHFCYLILYSLLASGGFKESKTMGAHGFVIKIFSSVNDPIQTVLRFKRKSNFLFYPSEPIFERTDVAIHHVFLFSVKICKKKINLGHRLGCELGLLHLAASSLTTIPEASAAAKRAFWF